MLSKKNNSVHSRFKFLKKYINKYVSFVVSVVFRISVGLKLVKVRIRVLVKHGSRYFET